MAESEEDDYMSDAFLKPAQDVRPGITMVRRVKEVLRKEERHKEVNIQNRQKSLKQVEQESREAALQSSISSQNKGFAMLQKMGYSAGQGLGKDGAGRVEPVPLNIKTDREGLGMEQLKKRKAEENLQNERRKVQLRQEMESKSLDDFRQRKREEKEKQQTEGDLRKSQRVCEQLDSQTGITVPWDSWYWPEVQQSKEEEEDEEEEEESCNEEGEDEEKLTPEEKLQLLTSYLRSVHFYCIWCGTAFSHEEDLKNNCPGDTAADHND